MVMSCAAFNYTVRYSKGGPPLHWNMEDSPARNIVESLARKVFYIVDAPVTWFRENVVVPNRPTYYYYHRKYQRVPAIDECEEEEPLCMYEANEQFKRDRRIDDEILNILRRRKWDCVRYEGPDAQERCKKIFEDYDKAVLGHFIKYGDMGVHGHAKQAYMKQKHRLVYERRQAEGKIKHLD